MTIAVVLLRRVRNALRFVPTRRFAFIIAAVAPVWLASSVTAGVILSVAATGLLLLVGLVDALAIPGGKHVRVTRKVPESVAIASEGRAIYTVDSVWPLRLDVEIHDTLTRGLARTSSGATTSRPWRIGRCDAPPRGRCELEVRFEGRQRGAHAWSNVVARIAGPLGLVRRTLSFDTRGETRVVPSIAGVRHFRLLALQHRLREAGVRTIRRRGEGTSFANLREYREGDDPRHIDWKATARRGKLISREYSVEQGQTIVIAIDAGRMMTQLAGRISRFEHALAAATVLADVALRSADHVAFLAFNDEVRAFVPAARGSIALQRIRDAMIPLQANMTEPDYAGAFRTLAARHRKRSLIVLFTDVVDVRASRALIAHTVRSTARHLPLIVALQNDALVERATVKPNGKAKFYESAAAEELLLEREAALARMRQAGVSVLDVSPLEVTAAVVNRYLAIKARASL